MMNLKKRIYFLEYAIGLNEIILYVLGWQLLLNSLMVVLLTLKWRVEGFRVNIFIFVVGKVLALLTGQPCVSALMSVAFLYYAHKLVVYELPSEGIPVGHRWHTKLSELGLHELSIYYPAQVQPHSQMGQRWMKTHDYASRMNDTVKKDNRPSARNRFAPKLFFSVVSSQFYKFTMNLYDKAAVRQQSTPYPIIVLSPGLASHCDGYSVYARHLAQLGYIVLCPEHVEHIRNILASDAENRIFRIAQLMDRYRTIQRTLDVVYDGVAFNKLLGTPPDQPPIVPQYTNISIMGHSFGGSTAIYTTFHDKRITGACIAYDPAMYVFEDGLCTLNGGDLHVPLLNINAEDYFARLYHFMQNDARLQKMFRELNSAIKPHCMSLYINDQQHADFSDLPLIWHGEAKLYGISKKLDEIHFRAATILSLTKTFLEESQRYHAHAPTPNLKHLLTQAVRQDINEEAVKLIRWA